MSTSTDQFGLFNGFIASASSHTDLILYDIPILDYNAILEEILAEPASPIPDQDPESILREFLIPFQPWPLKLTFDSARIEFSEPGERCTFYASRKTSLEFTHRELLELFIYLCSRRIGKEHHGSAENLVDEPRMKARQVQDPSVTKGLYQFNADLYGAWHEQCGTHYFRIVRSGFNSRGKRSFKGCLYMASKCIIEIRKTAATAILEVLSKTRVSAAPGTWTAFL